MKKLKISVLALLLSTNFLVNADGVLPAANGIQYPVGLKNWRVIATSYRTDNNTQRVILGNKIAIDASRRGDINPWPKGSVLAKLVWKNIEHPKWKEAIIPGEFVHSEIMVKDAIKFKSTGGWGYARWKGDAQVPYGKDATFSGECVSCHTRVNKSDYVFTIPAKTP